MTKNLFDRLDSSVKEKLNGNWAELARITGLTPSTLQGIKEGKDPRANTLLRISDALNISIDWLLSGQGAMYRGQSDVPPEELRDQRRAALLAVYDALNEEQQRELLAAAQKEERFNKIEQQLSGLLKKLG